MALETMGYTSAPLGGVEILANSRYTGAALTLDQSAFSDGLCLAGTPIAAGGMKASGADAMGILLHDVDQARPQATVVIGGYINTAAAEAHCGQTIPDGVKTALNNVVFL